MENPGNRIGQVHLQLQGDKNKYIYDVSSKLFRINSSNGIVAPQRIYAYLLDPSIIKAIKKGVIILGY